MLGRIGQTISPAGLRAIAEVIAADLLDEARRAFSQQRDPSTGQSWAPPAPRTLRDKAFRQLLVRTGELASAVGTDVQAAEGGATASLTLPEQGYIIRRGLVHLFGAKKARRKRAAMRLPARPWAGYPFGTIRKWGQRIIDEAVPE